MELYPQGRSCGTPWLSLTLLITCQVFASGQRGAPGPPGTPGLRPPVGAPGTSPVQTTPAPRPAPSDYRLVNAIGSPGMGRVEAFYNGTWRQVCTNYNWDNNDASVLCRHLGFDSGVIASDRSFPVEEPEKGEPSPVGPSGPAGPAPPGIRPGPPVPTPEPIPMVNLVFNCRGNESRMDFCPGQYVTYCYKNAAAICFNEETRRKGIDGIRLVTPTDRPATALMAMGRVEILHRGFWGTICNRGYTMQQNAFDTACMALGYQKGMEVYRNSLRLESSHDDPVFWSVGLRCGNQTGDLRRCVETDLGSGRCSSHYYDTLLLCVNTTRPYQELQIQDVRLTNTTIEPGEHGWQMGRVEVQVEGEWGTVCELRRYSNQAWTDDDASAICRSLGYRTGSPVKNSVFGGTNNQPVFVLDKHCGGSASSLNDCTTSTQNTYDCTSSGPGVLCTNAYDDCELRREAPTTPWGSPGFPPPPPTRPSPEVLRPFPGTPRTTTQQPEKSTPPPLPEKCKTRLRIVGSPEVAVDMRGKAGRVEYYYKGMWGPICASGFDDRDAHVICKVLGLKTGIAMANSSFGEGDGPNWLSNLRCAGNEDDLWSCLGYGVQNLPTNPSCSKRHQAGVVCEGDGKDDVAVRIVNMDKPQDTKIDNGIVEVRYRGQWGTICSKGWDDADATVICKQLGYGIGYAFSNDTKLAGRGMGPVWLEGVKCKGSEDKIEECEHSGWAAKSMFALCDHTDDAAVLCLNGAGQDDRKKEENKGKQQNSQNIVRASTSGNSASRNMLSSFVGMPLMGMIILINH